MRRFLGCHRVRTAGAEVQHASPLRSYPLLDPVLEEDILNAVSFLCLVDKVSLDQTPESFLHA